MITVKVTFGQGAGHWFSGRREPVHGGSDPGRPGRVRPRAEPPCLGFRAFMLWGEMVISCVFYRESFVWAGSRGVLFGTP